MLKLTGKGQSRTKILLYYTPEMLIKDIYNNLAGNDLVVQPFIRSKFLTKPCLLQYHMKHS